MGTSGSANVAVTNFPSTQNVSLSGTTNVYVVNPNVSVIGTANVFLVNANQNVTITNTASVSVTNIANVSVVNLPATQNVAVVNTANVAITNFPATQNVRVTSTPANQNVTVTNTANVAVTNYPSQSNINLNQVNGGTHSVSNPVFTETVSLYYPFSSANSTSAQLNAGLSFTGAIETILNLQAAQIEVVCDQPYTVNVYQYIDAAGLQLSSVDTFTRAAGQPLNENVTLPGNYFNLKITNNGVGATTTLAVNTTFGIMATGPRTNTNLGNYKTSIEEVGGVATAGSIPVRGNINATIIGVVAVNNFPTSQNVIVSNTANVQVLNWPATQNVYLINSQSSQNVTVVGTGNSYVTNWPATQNVFIVNTTSNQNVTLANTANVLVTNFPNIQNVFVQSTVANQNVTVTNNAFVQVTNFPATQNVLITNTSANQNVTVINTANVSVANWPTRSNVNLNQVNGLAHSVSNPVFTETVSLYYPSSSANSTATQLNAGLSFTGAIETILNLQAAQIEVVCDQPYTVYIYQYIDAAGTQLSSVDTFTRAAGQPLNENVTLPGNYFNLKVTNNGNATTTTLAVNTTFGIMATGPRTNTNLGNYKTSIEEVGGVATGGSLPIRGNVGATILGTSNVLIINLPAIQNVTVLGTSNVLVTNLPVTQNVSVTGTANVLVTNLPAVQNVAVTGTANVLVTNIPATQNVQVVANNSTAPIYVQYASSIQQDALGRLKVSSVQDQTWYAPAVDKDGDLRWVELFTSNVVTTTASSTRTSNILTLASSTGIYAGAVVTDGSGVLYSPPTYVVSVTGSNVLLNQNATVTSGAVLTFNNNTYRATAAGDQNSTSNLVVSSTSGISPWDQVLNITPGTANVFPFNTFVVSVANATIVTLNQNVSVSNADTISFSTASSYFNSNTSDITMTPGNTADGSAIRQTRITQRIIPGVSHTVYQSVNFNGNDSNTVKKFGLYDDTGGVYWQVDGTVDSLAAVVRRTQPDGTIYNDVVYRPSFNADPLDGTGPSKFNITTTQNVAITSWASTVVNPRFAGGYLVTYNVTTNQGNTFALGTSVSVSGVTPDTFNGTFTVSSYGTSNVTVAYPTNPGVFGSLLNGNLYQSQYHKYFTWWIEFIGGRTGRIRFGLGTTAGPTIAHVFNYSGALSSTFVSSPALPIRYEIYNTGAAAYHSTMLVAGSTFNLEAGQSVNPGFGVSAFTTGWLADSTLSPIMGFGLRAAAPFNSADLQLKSFTMLDTANRIVGGAGGGTLYGAFYWQLILNPSISGPIPVPVNVGKASRYWQYQPGANIVPNTGILVDSGFFTSQVTQSNETITNFLNMGKDVQGYNPDQLVLCVQQLAAGTNGGNIVATMNWLEFL